MATESVGRVAMGPEKVKLRVKDAAESNTRLERNQAAESSEPITRDDEKTPFENFESLTSKLLKVPKEEVDEERVEWEKKRQQEETS